MNPLTGQIESNGIKHFLLFGLACLLILFSSSCFAQNPERRWFTYQEKGLFGKLLPIKLEVTTFEPEQWNGKVIVFNHGSIGNDPSKIKFTWKFLKLNHALTKEGFRIFVLIRKGRGASEGEFTEERTSSCNYGSRMQEVAEAEPQVDQFVDWLRSEYKVDRVYMMGHSRGGFLSSYYGARHPEKVAYVVNISGGWATQCEAKTSQTMLTLTQSAASFKNQL
jgi:pimeloyl-ACP methyl ester carboxylesterase